MYINKFTIINYRSLKNVDVGDLSPAVIFYGENDSGKSNLLTFLDIIFQQKYTEEIIQAPNTSLVQRRSTGFWEGQIANFSNNSYLNNQQPIEFTIYLKFDRAELLSIKSLPSVFVEMLPKNRSEDVFVIEGKINPIGPDRAEMILIKAELNKKQFYTNTNSPDFLPDPAFAHLSGAERRSIFDSIMNKLDNAFLRIPPDRFISQEQEAPRGTKVELSAKSLKNWLFQLSHDQNGEKIVRQVIQQFNSKPFNHGNVSIIRVGEDEIEALVEGKNGLKLPIGRRGSGVQQILTILAYIAQANSPLVGIEELEINLSPETQKKLVNSLLELVKSKSSPVRQIFFTTHSPHIGKRNEAQRRGVWIENDETKVKKPTEAEVKKFFSN
jgi:hypothetical protein